MRSDLAGRRSSRCCGLSSCAWPSPEPVLLAEPAQAVLVFHEKHGAQSQQQHSQIRHNGGNPWMPLAEHAHIQGKLIEHEKEHTQQNADENLAADTAAPSLHERSEEHTSELQSLMRISYAVFCLKKK